MGLKTEALPALRGNAVTPLATYEEKSNGTTPQGPWTAPFPAARRARWCAAVSRLETLQGLDPRRAAGQAAVSPAAPYLVWQPSARHPNRHTPATTTAALPPAGPH